MINTSQLAHPKPAHRDGLVKLSKHEWRKRREMVCDLAQQHCERCQKYTPLSTGDAHHVKKRGMGGAHRDDRISNLEWLCRACHGKEHGQ